MLVSGKEILEGARQNHYALPAFRVSPYAMMKAVPFLVFADVRSGMKEVARVKLRTLGTAGRL